MDSKSKNPTTESLGCVLVCPLSGVAPEHLSRDMEEVASNINQMLDSSILKFEYFPPGEFCLDSAEHVYNAWFEVLATGEKFPMAVLESEQCISEDFNLCVKPDWFDGSIRWIGPAHKRAFQEALLAWTDRRFAAKANPAA
jgi:hypothetical protein